MEKRAPPNQASGAAVWTGARVWWLQGQWKEESVGKTSCSGVDTPGGMLNGVGIGAFPSNRWYGVIIMPWPLGGLALRAAPQTVRKVGWSFPSSSIAYASRHCMSLAWDYRAKQALEVLLDSASLMVEEQQFSTSAKATE